MSVFKCKMCGGDLNVAEGQTVCECEYCGSRQTVPTLDSEKKLTLFTRANRLRSLCEFDKAFSIYESIIADFPEEAEAYWGLILCKYGIEYVDDPTTAKKIPTCHRSSFDPVLDDPNFEMVMEYADALSRSVYRAEAKEIERLRSGILEVSSKEAPYDIFICYKETDEDGNRTIDSVIAQDVYTALTEKGYRVFFSHISLEDKLGQEYEPYIFAALHSAKIMLAFGTSYDYYNAVWVKNEWSRFLALIAKGEKKTLIPCYKGIDAYDMPQEFRRLQAQDMGKVGAIQDLLRGIEKILPREKKETSKETVVVQQQANANAAPLLKRAFMFLEDGDFARADEFCEQVLNLDPENAQAYLGKLMAELKVNKREQLKNQSQPFDDRSNYIKAVRFGDDSLKEELTSYLDAVVTTRQRNMDKRLKFADGKNRIVSGNGCTFGLKQDGTVVATKYIAVPGDYLGYFGQVEVSNWKDIIALAASSQCTIGLKADGTVVATKYTGDPKYYRGAGEVSGWKDIIAVTGSAGCTIGLKADGTVVATKYTGDPELYCGEGEVSGWKDIIAVTGSAGCTIGLKADGTVVATKYTGDPKEYYGQDAVSGWKDIIAVSHSSGCTIGLKADGTVVATKYTGDPKYYCGEGEVSGWKDIIAITGSAGCTIGLKADGTVVATKYTSDPKYYCGQGEVAGWENIVAIAAGDRCTIGLKADGTVVATKYTGDPRRNHGQDKVDDWTDIIAVTGGRGCTIGLKADGTVIATKYIETEPENSYRWYNKYSGQCDVGKWKLFDNEGTLPEIMQQRIRRCREASERRRQEMEREAERRKQEMEREAERRRQEMEREAERLRQETERKRAERIQELGRLIPDTEKQRQVYQDELANLKGLFTGKRRKELEAQIAEADKRIAALKEELDKLR